MDDEMSDVDTKCVYVPSFDELVFPVPIYNKEEVLENNEHITFVDIRNLIHSIRLVDTTFVEILFTKYYVLGPCFQELWNDFVSHRENFARYNPAAFVNVSYRAMKTVTKRQERKSYNPKLVAMVKRYEFLVRDYLIGIPLEDAYCPAEHEWLLQVKRGKYAEEEGMKIQYESLEKLERYAEQAREFESKYNIFTQKKLENYQRAFIWEQIKKEKIDDN